MKPMRQIVLLIALTMSGVQAEEVKLKHNGITLNANLELADGKTLKDGVVIMTHGTLAHSQHSVMSQLQEIFPEYGINSLAINLSLGLDDRHGMYDCQVPHKHKHTDALDEIGAWLEWAKSQGAQQVTLLGHSRGGNQTAWFAAEHDDPVIKQVVLLAPQTWTEAKEFKGYEEKYGKPLGPLLAKAQAKVKAGQPGAWLEGIDFIYCKDTDATAASVVSYYQPDPRMDSPSLLPRIKKPVLVIAGSEDEIGADVVPEFNALPEKGQAKLVVIDGAGHMFRDLYAEEVVEAIDAFIQP
ncbi:MAG: alpha/beta hydrolase [Thiotrichales bacterium]